VLAVEGLSKTYAAPSRWLRPLVRVASDEPVLALHDISFQLAAGEVVGLVGPNGAGKTTLLKILATLLDQTSGTVRLDGFDTMRDPGAVRARLGVALAEERGLYWRLTGAANLELFGVLSGLSRQEARRRGTELLEQVGLAGRDKLVFGYSAGMRSRLNLARALIAQPRLLVLDEPTRSMDPVAAAELTGLVASVAAPGLRGVLLSSHRLEEVVATCSRVLVLDAGQLRYDGRPQDVAGPGGPAVALLDLLRGPLS
jgi:ABC-2 type transport system ATP-binding protein